MNNKIKQGSARSLAPLRPFIPENAEYFIGLPIDEIDPALLVRSGCPAPPTPGDAFLPRVAGPNTHFNAHGREEILKDGKKETLYSMVNSSGPVDRASRCPRRADSWPRDNCRPGTRRL